MTALTRIGMPLTDFIEQTNEQVFEIINGERIPKLPTVGGHNFVLNLLYQLLFVHLMATSVGKVFSEATYVLPDKYDSNWVRGSRTPDILYYAQQRWAAYIAADADWREKPYLLVPDFVAEIVSPTDTFSKLDEKIDAYLLDGVRLIWIIDPQRKKAFIHAPDLEQPQTLTGDALLDAREVIPGFQVVLSKLFE
jgi:Uma2 family endonuclease